MTNREWINGKIDSYFKDAEKNARVYSYDMFAVLSILVLILESYDMGLLKEFLESEKK